MHPLVSGIQFNPESPGTIHKISYHPPKREHLEHLQRPPMQAPPAPGPFNMGGDMMGPADFPHQMPRPDADPGFGGMQNPLVGLLLKAILAGRQGPPPGTAF